MFTLSVVGPELSLSGCRGMGGGETDESFRRLQSRGTESSISAHSQRMEEFTKAKFGSHYWKSQYGPESIRQPSLTNRND